MKIGVSGASGQLGAATVRELKARGARVVGISRTPEAVQGADEARFGDYDRAESLAAAYAGLDSVLIIPTTDLRPGIRGKQNVTAIDAAVAAGVDRTVFVSSAGTRDVPEPDVWASYYAAEQRLMRTAPKWSILRMNYYAEALAQEAQASLAHGAITGLAENRVAFVSRDDLAAAAAGLLLGEGHDGAIYTGTGPASLSGAERAEIIARVAGKPLGFLVLPGEALAEGMSKAGLPDVVVNTVLSIQQGFAVGGFDIVTGDIERLSGNPPKSLEQILRATLAQ
ncbi:MAG: NAD(P)H-binding protein [Porticoccaceae bacterium]